MEPYGIEYGSSRRKTEDRSGGKVNVSSKLKRRSECRRGVDVDKSEKLLVRFYQVELHLKKRVSDRTFVAIQRNFQTKRCPLSGRGLK